MKTTIAYARKHIVEMRRHYLITLFGLFLIAACLPLAFCQMLGKNSEFGGEIVMCLAWASTLFFTANAFREWNTDGYDAFCLTLPVSTSRRFLFASISSLVVSIIATHIFFWPAYYAWEALARFNCMTLEDSPGIFLRIVWVQVVLHSIIVLCHARGGRRQAASWLWVCGGFALFFGLVNLPEAAGWVSDNGMRFPNLVNETDIIGNNWRFTLTTAPLGKATEVVKVISVISVLVAFYVSAWLSLKERESLK